MAVTLFPTGQTLGVTLQRPIVAPYRAQWKTEALELVSELHGRLGELAVRIDHIGSTAIPSMPSKNVIDLQVSVIDLELATHVFDGPLSELGFQQSPYRADHVPAGRDGDPAAWEKRLWTRSSQSMTDVNLHVRRVGSPNERLALLFRDWFLAHPEAVPAYGAFKRSLAAVVDDTGVYADIKDPVVDLVIVAAEDWAVRAEWKV